MTAPKKNQATKDSSSNENRSRRSTKKSYAVDNRNSNACQEDIAHVGAQFDNNSLELVQDTQASENTSHEQGGKIAWACSSHLSGGGPYCRPPYESSQQSEVQGMLPMDRFVKEEQYALHFGMEYTALSGQDDCTYVPQGEDIGEVENGEKKEAV